MAATLEDVLITEELARRPSRRPDYRSEADAIAALIAALTDTKSDALQSLADAIVGMGMAESAGVSLQVPDTGHAQCFWRAVAGQWRDYIGMTMRIDQSPCGTVITRNTPLLLREPGRHFSMADLKPAAHEILMVPLGVDNHAIGTIWTVSHGGARPFEQEDVRLLHRLGALASAAYRLEAALRRSEEGRAEAIADLTRTRDRLRQLVEGVPLLLWRASGDGQCTWVSPQWARLTGQGEAVSHGHGWLDAVHPDDRDLALRAWRRSRRTKAFGVEYRLRDADADRYRWFQARAMPLFDEVGQIAEWLGTSTDIDDLKALREHERALRAELQHRVRNTLAVVRSMAQRTAERSETVDDFQMHFDARLGAFARTQSLAARDPDGGVDLETMIAEELFAYHAREGDQVTIKGSEVRLKPKIADMLGLAIHELTVNAVKYGGLSSDQGRVEVTWELEGAPDSPLLVLSWADAAPDRPASDATHHGFGSELIERSLVFDLDATTNLAIGPEGARCEIRLPLAGRIVESRT